ncbi:MAG: OB-fold nucleic acid binding domain-containing protein, partial [Actinomycetota bacterium]|nr:OB-fold nucleic acid binding domain-containing protein [Actinomycetota bacterium]
IAYIHDDLREILSDTYGLMIYQESVMRVAQKFAGYSLAEADNLRKACGKKIRELIKVEREKFVVGCVEEGYGEQIGTALFDIIEPFADYAFNKSHSYGYGLVAFQTAYLKANFPAHYLAALLTSVKDDKDKTGLYLGDAKEHGIDILVPDVNESRADFFPIISEGGSAIRFGLSGVRNVGEGVVGQIIAEREANGPYRDFADFLARSDVSVLNRRAMDSLIRAGALDSFGHTRRGLIESLDSTLERVMRKRKEDKDGIMGLFDSGAEEDAGGLGFEVVVPALPDDRAALLSFEKEMLGLYVSDHPVAAYVRALSRRVDSKLGDLGEPGGSSSEVMVLGGVVTALSRRYTKRGELMASFVLEDLSGSIDVFVFPKTMAEYGAMLADDKVVLVKGRINQREDERTFVAMSIEEVEAAAAEEALEIRLDPGQATRALLSRIRSVLVNHPGRTGVLLRVGENAFDLSAELKVAVDSGSLIGELREFLRPESLVL